jgi:hypothetical protein
MTPGTLWQKDLLKMFVEVEEGLSLSSCQTEIEENCRNILKKCGSYQEDAIFTMQVVRTKPTIIAIYYVLRKTPEKNGAT